MDQRRGKALGGVESVVEMMAAMEEPEREKLLKNLAERDPKLVERIRNELFTFQDLQKLSPKDFQALLQKTRIELFALALKGAPKDLDDFVRSNISERTQELLTQETEILGQRRKSEVELARKKIMDVVKALIAEGRIKL